MKENENIIEAKKSIKAHIKFLESLLTHLKGTNESLQARSMFAAWCIHRYFNDKLVRDIEKAIIENRDEEKK